MKLYNIILAWRTHTRECNRNDFIPPKIKLEKLTKVYSTYEKQTKCADTLERTPSDTLFLFNDENRIWKSSICAGRMSKEGRFVDNIKHSLSKAPALRRKKGRVVV